MGLFGRRKGGGVPPPSAMGPPMPFRNSAVMTAGYPVGHAPPQVQQQLSIQLQAATREIATMKSAPILNPNFGMIPRYLESLNRMLEPAAVLKGPKAGQRMFLMEVQLLIRKIRDRVYNRGIPLTPQEREVIASYSRHWQMSRGGPADMGSPESQIVLLSLAECAQM